jgi:hypothetical protein
LGVLLNNQSVAAYFTDEPFTDPMLPYRVSEQLAFVNAKHYASICYNDTKVHLLDAGQLEFQSFARSGEGGMPREKTVM